MSTEPRPTEPRPADLPPTPPGPPRRTAPRVIAVLTAALGSAIIVGALAGAALPTFVAAPASDAQGVNRDLAVDGVDSLDVDVEAASLSVVFADVDEASLEVVGSDRGDWVFERQGSALRVETPRSAVLSWFAGGNGRAMLTLPEQLADLDADVTIDGGSFDADGDFDALDVALGAGSVELRGTATTLVADVSAGRGDIDLRDVSRADVSLEAGELFAAFSGSAPDDVRAVIGAGTLDVTLPDETYAVTTEVDAGGVDNGLRVASDAPRTVHVEVSAGNARLSAD